MSDADALLAAVLTDPAADLPRLTLADFLDDQGESDRAEFIRVQVAASRDDGCDHGELDRWGGDLSAVVTDCHSCDLWRQMYRVFDDWPRADLPAAVERWWCESGWWHWPDERDTSHVEVMYRRGFVVEVRCTLAAFAGGPCGRCRGSGRVSGYDRNASERCPVCDGTGRTAGIAADLFRRHPVERVALTDRVPAHWTAIGHPYGWVRVPENVPAWLPEPLYRLLWPDGIQQGYPTVDAAWDALSAACVAYGRSLAGLPRLECGFTRTPS